MLEVDEIHTLRSAVNVLNNGTNVGSYVLSDFLDSARSLSHNSGATEHQGGRFLKETALRTARAVLQNAKAESDE